MSAFFVTVLVALLLAGAAAAFSMIRHCENRAMRLDSVGEDK